MATYCLHASGKPYDENEPCFFFRKALEQLSPWHMAEKVTQFHAFERLGAHNRFNCM